jgi:hypothetical protein
MMDPSTSRSLLRVSNRHLLTPIYIYTFDASNFPFNSVLTQLFGGGGGGGGGGAGGGPGLSGMPPHRPTFPLSSLGGIFGASTTNGNERTNTNQKAPWEQLEGTFFAIYVHLCRHGTKKSSENTVTQDGPNRRFLRENSDGVHGRVPEGKF